MNTNNDKAWNNFVMYSEPSDYEAGDIKRSAAISSLYMGLVNNGGINAFLTTSYYLDTSEVLESLRLVGASKAAEQFDQILDKLGVSFPAASEEARWEILENKWTEDLDQLDIMPSDTDNELLQVLEMHVQKYEDFYLNLSSNPEI